MMIPKLSISDPTKAMVITDLLSGKTGFAGVVASCNSLLVEM